MSDHVMGWALV